MQQDEERMVEGEIYSVIRIERDGERTKIITSSRRRDKIRTMWIGKRKEEEDDDEMEFEWMGEETKWGEDAPGWREEGWRRDIERD